MPLNFNLAFFLLLQDKEDPRITSAILMVGFIASAVFAVVFGFKFIEGIYVDYIGKRPLFKHFYIKLRKITDSQEVILKNQFSFYNRLSLKHKKYFRHRVATFLKDVDIMGKDGVEIDDEKKMLIAATAIMLTFGYRSYYISLIDKVLIYPEEFYSPVSRDNHKGEYNPAYRAIVLSWKDFKHGYKIKDDNINLGIHEFVHAMHITYLVAPNQEVSANIFIRGYQEITDYLSNNPDYELKMKDSSYIRDYAFTNQFEFLAVIIENFIETPKIFKGEFPEVYKLVKRMLNFNFSGY